MSIETKLQLGTSATYEFALSVARGLSDHPKRLDCRYLYDAEGSEIFERISEQPEYYLTRTEWSLLRAHAGDITQRTGPVTLVELGSGSSVKTQHILDAYSARFGTVCYTPVDVSASILEQAKSDITENLPQVQVDPLHGTFEEAFPLFESLSPLMLLFLGSTIGNFDSFESNAFWEKISESLLPGDYCLLGIDTNDDVASIEAAYNDAADYSGAFTRNIFSRMNRELGSDIDTESIEHVAAYNPKWGRVEIYASFPIGQEIHLAPLGRTFEIAPGEQVMTEISRKFTLADQVTYLETYGLHSDRTYSDPSGKFALLLLKRWSH